MPVVNQEKYKQMIAHAKANNFAFPAFNVTSMLTATAVLEGLANQKSDGIIQVSVSGAAFPTGSNSDSILGAQVIADFVRAVAEKYDINVALHTDHCAPSKVESFLKPLIELTAQRRAEGKPNLFQSHMFDGSELPLEENLALAKELGELCAKNEIILEVETGVVGGEEDGLDNTNVSKDKLYTTPEEMVTVAKELGAIDNLNFMLAATFGNVHGAYKPGAVVLKPKILSEGQKAVSDANLDSLDLVFHGGSGSSLDDIHETLNYGVMKMNVDTDTQYAFTRPVMDHMMKNYDGVLKIEEEVGNKKVYDPRSYLKKGMEGMANRVEQACKDLKSSGMTLGV